MNELPLVSIAVLSYNRPTQLKKALRALSQQSYPNLEIVISDDASTQPAVHTVLDEFKHQNTATQVFYQEKNIGIIQNHKFLLTKLSGEYIMWACDDDSWHKDYVRVCVEALEASPEALLCTTNVSYAIDQEKKDLPLYENIDTQTLENGQERYKKVLKNILWWNHAFYSIIRRKAYDKVVLGHQFAFDISFILELSLVGKFIKLPYYYFSKSMGGIGNNVVSNLNAIKVDSWLIKRWARIGTALVFLKNIRSYSNLNWKQKYQLSKATIKAIRQKEMYPSPQNSFWRKISKRSIWKEEVNNFRRDLSYVQDEQTVHQLYQLMIPAYDVTYNPQNNLLKLHKLGIEVSKDSSILKWYHDLIRLSIEFDVKLEQSSVDNNIQLTYKNYRLDLKEGYYSFLIREVLVKEAYNIHLTQPTVVFDIGTNIGLTALYFAYQPLVKKVYGFEPFAETVQAAKDNFALNPDAAHKIELFNYGLLDIDEQQTVEFSFEASQLASVKELAADVSHNYALKNTTIQLKKASSVLPILLEKHPKEQKVLKVDCEGSEYEIFEDLDKANLIQAFDFIMLEWHNKGDRSLLNLLEKCGFKAFSIDRVYSEKYGNTGMIYAIKI